MFNFSEENDFENILNRLLENVDNSLDKRQGSIIYDALAPAAAELAQAYIALDVYADQTYLISATDENLDNKVADYGLTRTAATYAQRLATFVNGNNELMYIPLGSRWSIPNEYGGYTFMVTSEVSKGKYVLTCETAGTVGNEYIGLLLPLQSINNLGEAQLNDIYISGEDAETDEKLRQRALAKLRETPFGGNIADYKQFIEAQEGIGACLVIPVWNGGGTVKLVLITNSYEIPEQATIDEIQTIVDPVENSGKGVGKAPIGHKVTVVAPTAYNISVEANISIEDRYSIEELQDNIEEAIKDYIKQVQLEWSNNDVITIYVSRIIAAILTVEGVTNVENVLLNGVNNNIIINVRDISNPFPVLDEVIIHEN